MEFNEFTNRLIAVISDNYFRDDSDIRVTADKIRKNNGVEFTGINIRNSNSSICPTIYINSFFKEEMSPEDIRKAADKVMEVYNEKRNEQYDDIKSSVACYSDFDRVKEYIFFRLVNMEKNVDILENIPYQPFHDLAITFRWVVHMDDNGISSVLISKEDLKKWNVDVKDIYYEAAINTPRLFPCEITRLIDLIGEKIGLQDHALHDIKCEKSSDMYVVTNTRGVNGAATILYDGILDLCAKTAGGDIYLMPSSIHEMIFINAEIYNDKDTLKAMVKEANATVVQQTDILSDELYRYHCKTGILERVV